MTDAPTSGEAPDLTALLTRSADFYSALRVVLGDTLDVHTRRELLAQGCSGAALEHGASICTLLELDNVTSAIVLLRAQVEAVVRALWLHGVATDDWIDNHFAAVRANPQQDPNRTPPVSEMLAAIAHSQHAPVAGLLNSLKESAWNAFNAYVHSGMQAIVHGDANVPLACAVQVLQTSNGLSGLAALLMAMMTDDVDTVMAVRNAQLAHLDCLPPIPR